MTESELEEGRRRLARLRSADLSTYVQYFTDWSDWTKRHADALLASREEISRDAVREFAAAIFSHRVEVEDGRRSIIYEWRLVKEARARGVTLESEGGE